MYMPNTASARARSNPTRRPIKGPGEARTADSGEVRGRGGEFSRGADVSCGGGICVIRRILRCRQEADHPAGFGDAPADRPGPPRPTGGTALPTVGPPARMANRPI